MAELQCKICGKPLDIPDKALTLNHSCGAEIVLPSSLTDERIEDFNTGYRYFRALDYHKATSVFNKILADDEVKKDYEAHWCLALCEFKIEYYKNTVTKKIEIQTHYSGNGVFTENEHYKFAVKNSRVAVRKIYTEIGEKIDKIITAKKIVNRKCNEAYALLSQSEFEAAEKIFDNIIKDSSREPMVYIGKLLCELNFTEIAELATSEVPLTQFKNYNNAIQCADKETKVFLNTYNVVVSERLNLDEVLPDEGIHTLDEMEISADDTFEITSADKAIGFFKSLMFRFYEIRMYISERAGLFKALLVSFCILAILGVSALIVSMTVLAPTDYYKVGGELLQSGNVYSAAEYLALAKSEPDAVDLLKTDRFITEIHHLYNSGKVREALHLANLCGITTTKIEKLDMLINETVSSGENHTLAITKNKSVLASNTSDLTDYNECNVALWTDIISVSAGTYHSVGLKSDGNVLAVGDNRFGQCAVDEWTNIIAIAAGGRHTVGLKSDGTVVATEYLGETDNGQTDVSSWKNIIAISAGDDYSVGLLSNGTVVSTKAINGIEKWKDIIAISAGTNNLLGLTADGEVLSAKIAHDFGQNDCSEWQNIIKISAGNQHSLALQADGKLLSTKHTDDSNNNQAAVSLWNNIIAFSAGFDSSVGLTDKYEFVATSETDAESWKY